MFKLYTDLSSENSCLAQSPFHDVIMGAAVYAALMLEKEVIITNKGIEYQRVTPTQAKDEIVSWKSQFS